MIFNVLNLFTSLLTVTGLIYSNSACSPSICCNNSIAYSVVIHYFLVCMFYFIEQCNKPCMFIVGQELSCVKHFCSISK